MEAGGNARLIAFSHGHILRAIAVAWIKADITVAAGLQLDVATLSILRDGDHVFHTYSTYERGLDMLNVAYHYMDLVPKGRDEDGQGQSWVRRRDEYPD